MTGTGTQADPYIVDTWSDFVTAAGKSGAYVEIAKNTVWDMNDILPGGLTTGVAVKCANIEGNFAEIRNIVKKSSYILSANSSVEIYRLSFLNITETSGGEWFTQNGSGKSLNFYNCTITGMLSKGRFAEVNFSANSAYIRFMNDAQRGCNLNLVFSGNSALCTRPAYIFFENCLITLGGKSSYGSNDAVDFSKLDGCYIQGKCPWERMKITATGTNVFDLEIKKLNGTDSGNHKLNIVNFDKVGGWYPTSYAPTFVTGNQLHDAEYLKSVGFPIL
ncbi:MAG: hypothetical protein J6K77_00015 [Ruminococcus sp.]|nr:hypothetical protein [Ruminococcus sp.]